MDRLRPRMGDFTKPAPEMPYAATEERRSIEAHDLTVNQRLLVMLLNYLSLIHIITTLGLGIYPWASVWWRVFTALIVLFIVPALVVRIIMKGFPLRSTVINIGSTDFFKWWAMLNLQVLFCRLTILEETMRFVPALYSAWLRLWGSKIGRLVYWAPGTRILDRSFLDIGDDVIFGAGVRLAPHVMIRNKQGKMEVLLAPVKVGSRAVVGGYSLLTAGTELAEDEPSQACLLSPPFTKWRNGKRVKE
ncbi:MAG: hypothetical protein P8Z37_17275 [Acidobacteriota bacterium]